MLIIAKLNPKRLGFVMLIAQQRMHQHLRTFQRTRQCTHAIANAIWRNPQYDASLACSQVTAMHLSVNQ